MIHNKKIRWHLNNPLSVKDFAKSIILMYHMSVESISESEAYNVSLQKICFYCHLGSVLKNVP